MSRTAPPQSLEQSTLHTMLHDRDAQISSLLHQLHSISDSISSLQKELHHKSQLRKHQREDHTAAIKKLKEEHAEQRAHLARYESKIKEGGGLRVHEYAALMKAANKGVESSYVIRLQAQLCRAMHSLGVMESQLALVKENCSSLIKSMKEDLSHMVDDRTRREIELMNTLAVADAEKRAWQAEMEKKLREQEDLLDSVRDEYEELGLEYDEEEVRRALELQMLQESVERVKKEKALAEKDLLGALLEREEQIMKVRGEVEGLECALKGLKGEGGGETKDLVETVETVSEEGTDANDKVNDVHVESDESTPKIQSEEKVGPDITEDAAAVEAGVTTSAEEQIEAATETPTETGDVVEADVTTSAEEQIEEAPETPTETGDVQTADESVGQNTANVTVEEPLESAVTQEQSDDHESNSQNPKEDTEDISELATKLEDATVEECGKPDVTDACDDNTEAANESSGNVEGADVTATTRDNESEPAEQTKDTDIIDQTNTPEDDSEAQQTVDEANSEQETEPSDVEVKEITELTTDATKEERLDGSADEIDNNDTAESKESSGQ
jgi:hypothetical protein